MREETGPPVTGGMDRLPPMTGVFREANPAQVNNNVRPEKSAPLPLSGRGAYGHVAGFFRFRVGYEFLYIPIHPMYRFRCRPSR